MERSIYDSNLNGCCYYIVSVPFSNFNSDGFIESFSNLTNNQQLDEYTENKLKDFAVYGFTERRVGAAPLVEGYVGDQMVMFSYDDEFKSPVGLALVFDHKFYILGYKYGKRSESELYQIYQNRRVL